MKQGTRHAFPRTINQPCALNNYHRLGVAPPAGTLVRTPSQVSLRWGNEGTQPAGGLFRSPSQASLRWGNNGTQSAGGLFRSPSQASLRWGNKGTQPAGGLVRSPSQASLLWPDAGIGGSEIPNTNNNGEEVVIAWSRAS